MSYDDYGGWRKKQRFWDIQRLGHMQEPRCLLSHFSKTDVAQSEYMDTLRLLRALWGEKCPSDINLHFGIDTVKTPHETRTDVAWFQTVIIAVTPEAEQMLADLDNFILENELTK